MWYSNPKSPKAQLLELIGENDFSIAWGIANIIAEYDSKDIDAGVVGETAEIMFHGGSIQNYLNYTQNEDNKKRYTAMLKWYRG